MTGVRAFKPKNDKGMIVAECKSNEDKQCILRSKKQFVTTDGGEERHVYIDSDLTREDREMQNKLRWKAIEMRQQGKDVRIAMGKLKVDGDIDCDNFKGNCAGCWASVDIDLNHTKYTILSIYNNTSCAKMREEIEEVLEHCRCSGSETIMGGDFNARIGTLGSHVEEEKRSTEDVIINKEGKDWMDVIDT